MSLLPAPKPFSPSESAEIEKDAKAAIAECAEAAEDTIEAGEALKERLQKSGKFKNTEGKK